MTWNTENRHRYFDYHSHILTQATDLWWNDSEIFEEKRGNLTEISDLYGCWDTQVNEEDLHHSVAVHVCDLRKCGTKE